MNTWKAVATLDVRYVSSVSGPGADTDRIHRIRAEYGGYRKKKNHLVRCTLEADTKRQRRHVSKCETPPAARARGQARDDGHTLTLQVHWK